MNVFSTEAEVRQWTTHTPRETFELGKFLGSQLSGGEVILLDGPLGAGKTVFVKGIAVACGVAAEDVTSPSFTLVNPHVGYLPFFHIDLYRLDEGPAAAHAVDLDELLSNDRAIIVIEWGERLKNYPLPAEAMRVQIKGDGDEPRIISISSG